MAGYSRIAATILVAALAAASGAVAQERRAEGEDKTAHELHRNVASLFLGASREEGRRERTFGIEYERRFNESFGIGVVAERTGGDSYTWVLAAPFAYHTGPWKVYLGPGFEDTDEGRERLWRIGAEYGFETKGWEIAPQVDFDFVEGEEILVLGIAIGRPF